MNETLHIFTLTGDGAFAVDKEKRIVFWNPAAEEMFGYKAEDVLDQLCYNVMRGKSVDGEPFCQRHCPVFKDSLKNKPPDNFDLLMRHKDGRSVRVNISTIRMPDGPNVAEQISLLRLRQETADWEGMLRISLLGPMTVTRSDGTQVKGILWQRIKVRALLTYLALHQGQPVSRETLIELLWPEMDYETARNNLNTTVYNLRRSLEPKLKRVSNSRYIVYEDGCYLLYGQSKHWLDVHAFTTDLRRARNAYNIREAIHIYEQALALYRGDYLQDLTTTGIFSFGEQNRLRHLYLSALEDLGELHERQNRFLEAENLYLKVLAIDPCIESACQKLMRLSINQGHLAEAAVHYQRLAEALNRELNVEPSMEIKQLRERVQQSNLAC